MAALQRATTLIGLFLFGVACEKAPPTDVSFTISPDDAALLIGESVQLTPIGAPRDLMWSSSNEDVASVVQETGFVTGESRGSATISAVAGSAVASMDVTVRAPARVGVPGTVAFEIKEGDPDPAPATVDIENGGAVEQRLYRDTWDMAGYDLMPKLRSLSVPTLVITGDHDFFPVEVAGHIAQSIPDAKLVTIKDCGHLSFLECADEVRNALNDVFPGRDNEN